MEKKFAVLIDVDNISYSYAGEILDEIKKYGVIVICRAYGDWSSSRLTTWLEKCINHGIRPMMQIQAGKNSSDGLMFLDAMEIRSMNPIPVDSFCLVSSDSDFSSLSTRLRESGFYVIGIGNENTKNSYINTLHMFIYLSNLKARKVDEKIDQKEGSGTIQIDPISIINEAYESINEEKDWVYLSQVGWKIHQNYPSFDYRTYGFGKMLDLIKACSSAYEIKIDNNSPPGYLIKQKNDYQKKNSTALKKGELSEGTIEKIVFNYGFINSNNLVYFFHAINLKNCEISKLIKGSKVKFVITKEPDPFGETNQEKNGIAAEVEIDY